MRKWLLLAAVGVCLTCSSVPCFAAETASQKLADEDESSDLMKWKLINTAIFAALVGFTLIKYAPAFFNARSLDIQKAIKDATGLKIEADFRYSAIDKKMANLSDEVARLKAEAAAEMQREHERLQHETEEELEHIMRNSDHEVEFLRAEGIQEVKRHTTQLAFGMAEHRLQAHFAQNDDQNNVGEFVELVGGRR